MIENFELFLSLAGTIFSLVIACIIFIIKIIKIIKSKKQIMNSALLEEAVPQLMGIAERFCNYSGDEKKEFVMTKINQFAIENGFKFEAETISNKIEEFIKLSKEVNYRKTNEEK